MERSFEDSGLDSGLARSWAEGKYLDMYVQEVRIHVRRVDMFPLCSRSYHVGVETLEDSG